jgi:hypothetical protein
MSSRPTHYVDLKVALRDSGDPIARSTPAQRSSFEFVYHRAWSITLRHRWTFAMPEPAGAGPTEMFRRRPKRTSLDLANSPRFGE